MDGVELQLETRLNRSQGRERRSRSFGTKLTRAEEAELYSAAKAKNKYAGEWAREVLLREARRTDDDALFTELVATRMLMVNLLKPLILGKPVSQDWITDAMAAVRREKRKAAQEVRQQYTEETAGGQ
jgi:hypothetical protein